jgi:hypothetical protein
MHQFIRINKIRQIIRNDANSINSLIIDKYLSIGKLSENIKASLDRKNIRGCSKNYREAST